MSSRIDTRAQHELPIRVFGMDSEGKPINEPAFTVDVSRHGARLRGVTAWNTPGEIIGIRYGAEKARFRIAWVGQRGTVREGQIGVTCIDHGRYIWGIAPPEEPRPAMAAARAAARSQMARPPAGIAPLPTKGNNRRRSSRYKAEGHAKVQQLGASAAQWATLHDLSLGGCYVETTTPLAALTAVEVLVNVGEIQIGARGVVTVKHALVGMGIEFTEVSPLNRERLDRAVSELISAGAPEV
jgi:hypothetical protein